MDARKLEHFGRILRWVARRVIRNGKLNLTLIFEQWERGATELELKDHP
ncbi:hypothetical protein [Sinomonas terrae]|uniref:Uncharacterized protein n=1 Tax=Sinomonas terrae TaxID=2908838 RepID=A0ABS9TW83_9MICC|nr:hypothetical protein [Sinomonas terrae]MCH6468678.1 hypothetical protein [Sinomonas terrae]